MKLAEALIERKAMLPDVLSGVKLFHGKNHESDQIPQGSRQNPHHLLLKGFSFSR
ncbi:MAG: hypothetical protein HQM08_19865 [Candidatus Riflebacteria bacterium]|nr:hypothetical protein [Candidatus Riflebacteria bacterium]